jgi:uncharacterized protein
MSRILFLLFFVLATGTASAAPPVRSLLEIRREHVIVQQWDVSCGAAALATLLTFQHGDPAAEREVAESMLRSTDALRVRHRGGFSLLDMTRFAKARGYAATAYRQATLADLDALQPAIVPIRQNGSAHFVIYRGRVADSVLVADPAFGNRVLPLAAFEAAWTDGIAFVVERRDGRPPPNALGVQENDFALAAAAAVRRFLP